MEIDDAGFVVIGPIANMVVGAGFILQALYFSSRPESFETEEE